jgi:hypothetical protein
MLGSFNIFQAKLDAACSIGIQRGQRSNLCCRSAF